MVGRFAGVPDELPYLMPQDFGTRTGVRWYDLLGGPGPYRWTWRLHPSRA